MSWPRHQNPSSEDRTAHAPYNFVPLPDKVIPAADLQAQDRYYEDRKTGYLDCHLTTRSPLYVRCGLTPEEYEGGEVSKSAADFFYTDPDTRVPAIPGSSLRGMLRTLVEIIGYGKVQPVSKEHLVYRAVGDTTSFGLGYRQRLMCEDKERHFTPLMRAGYMERRGLDWYIRPAQNIGGTTFARIWHESVPGRLQDWHDCKNARKIWVKPGPYEYKKVRGGFINIKHSHIEKASAQPEEDLIQGVWVRSGKMFSKKFDMVVFPADEEAKPIPIPDELITAYCEQLSQEQIKLLGNEGVIRDKQPVFYLLEDGNLVFFGHTMMFRLPYQKSPNDYVPSELRSENRIDLAEAIFGYVGLDVEEQSRAGRVFFSDAKLAQAEEDISLSEDPMIPQILSSPKPTTFQHYLVQQTPDEQPAGKTKDGKPKYKVVLSHYASPTPDDAVIRGHKLYWHKGKVGQKEIAESEEVGPDDTQHTHFKPVRGDVRFRFRIYFENLSQVELGVLLWALTLPGPGDYCHKLGMGKPLGMGAVKIESHLHLIHRQIRYRTLFDGDGWELGLDVVDVEEERRQALDAFERAILDDDVLNPGGQAQALAEVPRIQTLLTMLSWPGPPPENTRYITVLKEFTRRKVLPTPLDVVGEEKSDRSPSSRPATTRPVQAVPESGSTEPGLKQWQEVEATVTGDWHRGEVMVDLPGGLKGKLKTSKKDAPRKGERLNVVVDRQQGAFYLVVLP